MTAKIYSYIIQQSREKVSNHWLRMTVSALMLSKALKVLLPRMPANCENAIVETCMCQAPIDIRSWKAGSFVKRLPLNISTMILLQNVSLHRRMFFSGEGVSIISKGKTF